MKRTPFDLFMVFLAIIPFHFASSETLPSTRPTKCHEQERSALLEFKQSLFLRNYTFWGDPSKLESWKLEDGDCCGWEGVECDVGTGYVTGLDLSLSCLSGPINSNASLFRLVHLQSLNLAWNHFNYSHIPSAIGDLLELTSLNLTESHFGGQIPSSIGSLTQLTILNFKGNKLSGEIPSSIGKLVQLFYLDLSINQLTGQVPAEITSLTQLTDLDLSFNGLTGLIPEDISNLKNLHTLSLQSNNLNGTLRLDVILRLQHLYVLLLSFNEFSSIIEPDMNASLSNLFALGLASSNLSKPPIFLSNQSGLALLDLSQNSIYGTVPPWFFNVSTAQLEFLNLSSNFITSFTVSKWTNLTALDLRHNHIRGLLPLPPKTIVEYFVSDNKLSGEISPEMCQLSYISMLDLSKNKLTGVIPPCLSNLTDTIYDLNLHGNDLYGRFPQLQDDACALNMIDVSGNRLQGSLPRGLANCSYLQFLNFGNNQMVDTFPTWMGSLSNLKVLILRSNKFHGAIEEPEDRDQFPHLRIVDLSMNNFSGSLPSAYFDIWRAMKVHDAYDANYYGNYVPAFGTVLRINGKYDFSMTIMNKGTATEYQKILGYLTVIDLSSNDFIGEIPNSVGSLAELRLLNLSNNALTGSIPSSLANLTELESLDLSSNKLSGMIPPALTQLNFLAFFNVSDNYLSGPIPHVKQFATFQNDSYGENLGLCGVPLAKKCGNPVEAPPAPPSGAFAEEDSGTWFEENWEVVLMGLGSGLVIGVVLGLNTTSGIERWFLSLYRGRQRWRIRQIRFV